MHDSLLLIMLERLSIIAILAFFYQKRHFLRIFFTTRKLQRKI
ncbi:MAG: hypothetical protein AB7E28_04985 [Desulfurella sp.]